MTAEKRQKAKVRLSRSSALQTYQAKRDFKKTTEPKPAARQKKVSANRFVVQKHDARRLHFDLRLELNGVLKSWAVTKGPSMTSGVRRLAVETEDHPIGYLAWEGVIPKGQYGGGTMIVWDQGTWTAEGDAAKALQQGKLTFGLDGERLKGHWSLVRMKSEGKRHNWLLIKGNDEFALKPGNPEPVLTEMTSLRSGLANSDLTADDLRPDHKARQAKMRSSPVGGAKNSRTLTGGAVASTASLRKLVGAKGGILPVFVEPSLAMSVTEPPPGKNWIHEIKHDGYRVQARLEGGKVTLLTRKGLDWTSRFPPIAARLAGVPVGSALIDGEVVVQDASGQSTFSGLQDDLKARRHGRLAYFAFDILFCNGIDLRGVRLVERKEVLKQIIAATAPSFALRFNDHLTEQKKNDLLTEACRLGLEGIVSKRQDLPYMSGRGEHWQKSKCALRQEFVIVGYVPNSAQSKSVGSLILGFSEGGDLVHAGRAGTGLNAEQAASLAVRLEKLRAPKPAFASEPTALSKKGVRWVKPELGAEIEYRGWTTQGLLRQAAVVGLRDDKPAAEIVLEQPAPPRDTPQPAHTKSVASAHSTVTAQDIRLTHPDKILWADAGITKQMLVDYYRLVADRCLAQLADRVLALLRCPDGTSAQCFFAKHAWMGASAAVRSVDVGSEKPMLAIDDVNGLASLVQMNVLEMHVWGSKTKDIERPDRMIFDLDPADGVDWKELRAAALEVKDRLSAIKLESFVKSTGGKGLHVVVPVSPDAHWEQVKDFSKAFAALMVEDSPEKYVAVMTKARRRGKIFIDYLRNGRGATAVAPYSPRARPGAPVAIPLAWKDIATEHPLYTVADLLKAKRLPPDPWADINQIRQKLPL